MKLILTWAITLVLNSVVFGTPVNSSMVESNMTVVNAFEGAMLVPDVIPKAPATLAKVVYPSGVTVYLGNELTPTQVKDVPTVTWASSPDQYYTLVFTDPDVPSRTKPEMAEFQHWFVGNVPGDDLASGDTFSQYVGAAPPLQSGLHRYVFLVYKQPGLLTFVEPRLNNTSAANRTHFSVASFARKYNLSDPIAGNFFQAQYDEYVPILNKQLFGDKQVNNGAMRFDSCVVLTCCFALVRVVVRYVQSL